MGLSSRDWHLSSISESMEPVIRANRHATGRLIILPRDIYALTAPFNGGTHPLETVVRAGGWLGD